MLDEPIGGPPALGRAPAVARLDVASRSLHATARCDAARGLDGLEAPGGVEGEASGALCSQDCRAAKRQWNLM